MLVLYDSRPGNVARFIGKTGLRSLPLAKVQEAIREPFVLVTYTTGFGQIPERTRQFLQEYGNHPNLAGVAASGNRNWGANFAASADKLARLYNVPVLLKFELSGTAQDIQSFQKEVDRLAHPHRTEQPLDAEGCRRFFSA